MTQVPCGRLCCLAACVVAAFAVFVALDRRDRHAGRRESRSAPAPGNAPRPSPSAVCVAGFRLRRQVLLLARLIGVMPPYVRRLGGSLPAVAACRALVSRRSRSAPTPPAAPTRTATSARRSCSRRPADRPDAADRAFTWPDVPYTLDAARIHARSGPERTLAPIYPPGLPLMMAPFTRRSTRARVFLVVPLCAACTVWFCFRPRPVSSETRWSGA